ncbi:MAG: site-2 protease family protein [Oscillospiraceae bacterium]|jgi:regulator of sigma E protease|nr:site-2 protease family protein [Oscillospiraceae bacterium]
MTILIAVLVFGVLIFAHEFGHFATAKWLCGMQVNEFAMGMGPKILSCKKGETTYSLRLFPIGGFCAVEGEDEASDNPRAFANIKIWKRVIFTVAGSLMNLLLGLVIIFYLTTQMPLVATTQIAQFQEGAVSGQRLREGDVIRRINGHRVGWANDISYELMRSRDPLLDFEVEREGEIIMVPDVEFLTEEVEGAGSFIILDFKVYGVEKTPLIILSNTLNWMKFEVKTVLGSLQDLVTGRYGLKSMSGPVGVTTAIGEAAGMGLGSLLELVSFITVNLGVFNLLPLPALDGGRLLFLIVEGIRRRPLPARYEGWVHAVGFVLLIGLMLAVTASDIIKLF